MNTKSWYASKTIWFNIIVAIVGILSLPTTIQLFPAVDLPYLLGISSAGNWVLRTFYTNIGISTPTTPSAV